MKIDGGASADLALMPERAKALEAAGYDGLLTAETAHDPFLPLALAVEHTERIEIGTSIAVAFGRTPMLLANLGHDLNAFSQGRFVLGLGSQIRPHITKRFSMPWSHPAPRMREMVSAMRAIWDCWYNGTRLDFKGDFYTHTLMTPFFTPTNNEYGAPKVFLAAVGPLMTEVAGEVCDGIICHSFTTERYVREVTIPAIEKGLAKAGKTRADFEVKCPVFVVSGDTEEEFTKSRQQIKQQIGFYGSTPAYRGVLEAHGWGDLQGELNAMSKRGKWVEMGEMISDDILDAFAVQSETPEGIAQQVVGRFGDIVDRTSCAYMSSSPEKEAALVAAFKTAA
ncbi:MAG: LLM class F420-dependent oxidoreductase [Acidobacteriota bacterium]|nr:LLM class F420-dependent oxidoreductase [Acidobacteriota bacterium]